MSIKYSEEFKWDAVVLVESGISQKTVCKDLGISKSALGVWVQDAGFQSHGMIPRVATGSLPMIFMTSGTRSVNGACGGCVR